MVTPLLIWVTAAVLGQGPTEAAWSKVGTADVDVAIRGRSLETIRDDLTTMLRAIDPSLGQTAGPALADQLTNFEASSARPPRIWAKIGDIPNTPIPRTANIRALKWMLNTKASQH